MKLTALVFLKAAEERAAKAQARFARRPTERKRKHAERMARELRDERDFWELVTRSRNITA